MAFYAQSKSTTEEESVPEASAKRGQEQSETCYFCKATMTSECCENCGALASASRAKKSESGR